MLTVAEYKVTGTDLHGNRVTETIEYVPLTRRRRIKTWVGRRLPFNLGYTLGLTKFRYITRVTFRG